MVTEWTTEEVADRLARGEKLNLIDVRERDEWQAGHIPAARLIPMSELAGRLDELEREEGEPLVFICRSGARSGRVCEYLAQQGYNVVNVAGGMLAWEGDVETGA